MPTILLRADHGDRPPDVLLVDDPELASRAAGLLDTSPERAGIIAAHRGLAAFSGEWADHPVTIQTTGVGSPAVAMVVEELLMVGARRFVRVAPAMAVAPWLHIGGAVVAVSASAVDGTSQTYLGGLPLAPIADFGLVCALVHAARAAGVSVHTGGVATVDVPPDTARLRKLAASGILATDLGTSPLFVLAARASVQARPGDRVRAAAILWIDQPATRADSPASGDPLDDLIRIALAALIGPDPWGELPAQLDAGR